MRMVMLGWQTAKRKWTHSLTQRSADKEVLKKRRDLNCKAKSPLASRLTCTRHTHNAHCICRQSFSPKMTTRYMKHNNKTHTIRWAEWNKKEIRSTKSWPISTQHISRKMEIKIQKTDEIRLKMDSISCNCVNNKKQKTKHSVGKSWKQKKLPKFRLDRLSWSANLPRQVQVKDRRKGGQGWKTNGFLKVRNLFSIIILDDCEGIFRAIVYGLQHFGNR